MILPEFLVKAKKSTYAGEGTSTVLGDGSRELVFTDGNFTYRDRYFGSVSFSGEEVVFEQDVALWSMNYYGGTISAAVSPKDVTNFLKKAMSLVQETRPFRGPESFEDGNFRYKDTSTGDLASFSGEEVILYKRDVVYKLLYHGGYIKK